MRLTEETGAAYGEDGDEAFVRARILYYMQIGC